MNNDPVFSIVIPTYQRSRPLRECLEALRTQVISRDDAEVIIVNDGGATGEINGLEKALADLPLRVLHLPENRGPAAARNSGIRSARGVYVIFLDDDSVPAADWLKNIAEIALRFPALACFGGLTKCNKTDTLPCRVNSVFFNWYLTACAQKGEALFLATCNSVCKKEMLLRIGGFSESYKNAAGEDRDLFIRLKIAGAQIRLFPGIQVFHEQGLSLRSYLKRHWRYGQAACGIYGEYPHVERLSVVSYCALFLSTWRHFDRVHDLLGATLLMGFSQVATVSGYVKKRCFSRGAR